MTRADVVALVRAEMDRRGMTQAQTAEAAGMTQPNLSDWLRGVSDVRGDTLLRLLRAVGIEPCRARAK